MKIGEAGDGLSLARVIIAMAAGAIVLGVAGYLFDRAIGPMIAMSGWWTVSGSLGLILGGMFQAAREWAIPQPAERRAVTARLRERAAAESAADESDTDEGHADADKAASVSAPAAVAPVKASAPATVSEGSVPESTPPASAPARPASE